jgi:hypothetical protein
MPATTGFILNRDELRQQIAVAAYGTDDLSGDSPLSQFEIRNVDRMMRNGLRKFYYPGGADGFDWSFLEAEFTLVVDPSTVDYTQPATFGGLKGGLVHIPNDNVRLTVQKTTVRDILERRQFNLTTTNYTMYYAERPVHRGGISPTTWQLMTWPTPNGKYTYKGIQRINPIVPTAVAPFLYGGPEHSQTILEACLSEVELFLDGTQSVHTAAFQERLAAAMSADTTMHAGDSLGLNVDPDTRHNSAIMRDGRYFENFDDVTVGGTRYSG